MVIASGDAFKLRLSSAGCQQRIEPLSKRIEPRGRVAVALSPCHAHSRRSTRMAREQTMVWGILLVAGCVLQIAGCTFWSGTARHP